MNEAAELSLRRIGEKIVDASAGRDGFIEALLSLARHHEYFVHKASTRPGTDAIKRRLKGIERRASELAVALVKIENAGAAQWIDDNAPGVALTVDHQAGESLRLAGYQAPVELAANLDELARLARSAQRQIGAGAPNRDFRAATVQSLKALLAQFGANGREQLLDAYQAIAHATGDLAPDDQVNSDALDKLVYRARKRSKD